MLISSPRIGSSCFERTPALFNGASLSEETASLCQFVNPFAGMRRSGRRQELPTSLGKWNWRLLTTSPHSNVPPIVETCQACPTLCPLVGELLMEPRTLSTPSISGDDLDRLPPFNPHDILWLHSDPSLFQAGPSRIRKTTASAAISFNGKEAHD